MQVSEVEFGEGELLVVVTLGDHAEAEAVEEVASQWDDIGGVV
jgi:hypothetical protein